MRIKDQAQLLVDAAVSAWMESNAGTWFSVAAIARAVGSPVSATNSSLRRLHSGKQIDRDDVRKTGNGKTQPVYRQPFSWVSGGPEWMQPRHPEFSPASIVGIRVRVM